MNRTSACLCAVWGPDTIDEHERCTAGETYADLVFSLKSVYPDFPSPDGGKPVTFRRAWAATLSRRGTRQLPGTLSGLVLNICQNEFEELLASSASWTALFPLWCILPRRPSH